MMSIYFVRSLFFFVLVASGFLTTISGFAAQHQRNVVLFVADDMSQDAGCYGNTVIKTPHLDALAKEATLFTHSFCTTASCSPSRAVIMTGLHNHTNGQYGLAHAEHGFVSRVGTQSLPTMMRKAGYRTARIGRTVHVRPRDMYEFKLTIPPDNTPLTLEKRLYGRSVIQCVQDARKFIRAKDVRPFFLMFNTCDAHRFGHEFKEKPGKPNSFANNHQYPGVKEVHYDPKLIKVPAFLTDNLATRAELAEYYRSVSRIDQGVGGLIKVLKETGHWDDTLFLFISDHGMSFPGAKTTVYEPGLRCPCIIRSPHVKEHNIQSDAMVSWTDITPTILDYANALPKKNHFHGRSLLPTLAHKHVKGWDTIYASHTFHEITMYYPMRVVRGRRYKLILNIAHQLPFPIASDLGKSATWQSLVSKTGTGKLGNRPLAQYLKRPQYELFDLQQDPQELHNLITDQKYEAKLNQMIAKLKTFQQKTRDPWQNK